MEVEVEEEKRVQAPELITAVKCSYFKCVNYEAEIYGRPSTLRPCWRSCFVILVGRRENC